MAGCQPYTQQEIDLILDAMSDDLQTQVLFKLGLSTGLRISELLSLRVEDILNPDGSSKTRIKVFKRNTKGRRRSQVVVLTSYVSQELSSLALSTQIQGREYLFSSRESGDAPMHRSTAWRRLEKYSRQVRIFDTGCHRMRKTFAQRVYEATDKNIYETQKALGHKSIDSTTHYLQFDRDDLDTKIEGLF